MIHPPFENRIWPLFPQIEQKPSAEEMKSISKGLEEVEKELDASEDDGPISEVFH